MHRREHKPLGLVGDWFIKVLSFGLWSIVIIFTGHDLKIGYECLFNLLYYRSFGGVWVQRLSSLPVVFIPLIKKIMISGPIARSLVDVSQLIIVLGEPTSFVEELFEMGVVQVIILRTCYVSSVIPRGNSFVSRLVNSFLESIHFL